MQTNTDCTIYKYDGTTGGYNRVYIPTVFWRECKAANVLKSGLQGADSVIIYIPIISSGSAPQTAAKDMCVKGNCGFVFDNTSQQTISDGMKAFRQHKFVTVSSIDVKRYGIANLQHIKISAK